jgi:ABC-type Fe3+/spermidine/putrescine transport system ATPase subunit
MSADPLLLDVRGAAKAFGGTTVLAGVDLGVHRGEFVSLLGPSGCGKTTLLRIVAGLLGADGGTVRLDGADITGVPTHKRGVGVVFQSYALFPHLSVADNVAFGLKPSGARAARSSQRSRGSWISCISARWPIGPSAGCRADSSSAWRWPAHSPLHRS